MQYYDIVPSSSFLLLVNPELNIPNISVDLVFTFQIKWMFFMQANGQSVYIILYYVYRDRK